MDRFCWSLCFSCKIHFNDTTRCGHRAAVLVHFLPIPDFVATGRALSVLMHIFFSIYRSHTDADPFIRRISYVCVECACERAFRMQAIHNNVCILWKTCSKWPKNQSSGRCALRYCPAHLQSNMLNDYLKLKMIACLRA